MVFKIISKTSNGPKPKGTNLLIFNGLTNFFNSIFVYLFDPNIDISNDTDLDNIKFDATNIHYILDKSAISLHTCISNNIKFHFTKHLKHYIKNTFKYKLVDFEDMQNKTFLKKIFHKNMTLIFDDIYNNNITKTCDPEYHEWIDLNSYKLVPLIYKHSHDYNIDIAPFAYLKHMFYMASELEKSKHKLLQVFPLRTELILKHCPINTFALIDLMVNKTNYNGTRREAMATAATMASNWWQKFFNIDPKKYQYTGHFFDYQIHTDGYSASLVFINKKGLDKQEAKNKAMINGRTNLKILKQTKTAEEINIIQKNKVQLDKAKKEEQKQVPCKSALRIPQERECRI